MERERVRDVQRLGGSGAVLAGQVLKMVYVYQVIKILCFGDVYFLTSVKVGDRTKPVAQ